MNKTSADSVADYLFVNQSNLRLPNP